MSITIRKAVKSDAVSLRELNEKFNGKSSITAEQIGNSLENNDREEVFVAECDGVPVGFCCVQVFKSFCYEVDYAEVTEIYVADAYQRGGIGTKLLNHVEQYFGNLNINDFQLFTGGENRTARSFYEKNGYKKTSEIMYRKRGHNK